MDPSGAGPRVYAELARRKLENTLRRTPDGNGMQVGILAGDSRADTTEAPIAIVCQFPRPIRQETLRTCLRVAWSFCRSPLLVTAEPQRLRTWSCYERPVLKNEWPLCEARTDPSGEHILQDAAAEALHWIELASGNLLRTHESRFPQRDRADQSLIQNLKHVRSQLHDDDKGLKDYAIIHDLLARLIFVQFLFQRQDRAGTSALNEDTLQALHTEGRLSRRYTTLSQILESHGDTYALFRWLNEKVNGDLFPGKGDTSEEREAEWQREMAAVRIEHLRLLSRFVDGELELETGQYSLWPLYSFDAIPLEFISSIYEEFTSKTGQSLEAGAHYTPSHVVDFILDGVLPWNDDRWNLTVLDPACGSGIFLVKAYQRLIHRWRVAHPGEGNPPAQTLQALLKNNIFGVDINPEAVRVASFSLYLAMCDEIEPRYYWTQVHFPRMRGQRLIAADFFREDTPGFRTCEDAGTYDLIVGNAPWGEGWMTSYAREWAAASDHEWPVTNDEIGTLFLPKAAALTGTQGRVSMLQPAGALLFNRSGTAVQYRERLFSSFRVDEVVNLSAMRFGLFAKAISPACVIALRPQAPDGTPLTYLAPKPTRSREDDERLIIEPYDIHTVFPEEALSCPWIWSALTWGNRRDVALIRRLQQCPRLRDTYGLRHREGITRGRKNREEQPQIIGRRILASPRFPTTALLEVNAANMPVNDDPWTHAWRASDLSAFDTPQLLVKQSWTQREGRFRSMLVDAGGSDEGVLCTQSYLSIHHENQEPLEAACLAFNSAVAVYFLLLTSGRFAFYRPEPLVEEWLSVPIPRPRPGLLRELASPADIDARAREAFGLKHAEWVLVEDLMLTTLLDFKGDASSPGRQPTRRGPNTDRGVPDEPDLRRYCDFFLRVLKAGFGSDAAVCATIYSNPDGSPLPVRLIAIHLAWPGHESVTVEQTENPVLLERLRKLNERHLSLPDAAPGIFYQRVARVYATFDVKGLQVPTVFLVKPDQCRYWTRSMAMRDADEVAADILTWRAEGSLE